MNIKTLTIAAIIFFATRISAQTIVVDSSWLTNNNGIFYANRFQLYDNGNSTTSVTKVGDTTAVANGAKNIYMNTAVSLAADANISMGNAAKIKEIVRQDAALQTTIGKSTLNSIALQTDTTGTNFTSSGWQLRDNTSSTPTFTPITFSFNAQGAFRYKLGTETIKQAFCLGNVVRIVNYKGQGYALDFYKRPNGTWATIDLQQILIPPSK